jgi:hypothetical protein
MKKIGILTLYHKTYNYGAQLQAYALQKFIAKLGYNCEQIRFQWSNVQTEIYYESLGNKEKFYEFSANIPNSGRVYTPHDISDCAGEYNAFICGSDQIWGVNNSMPIYVLPQITLSFVPESKVKISYGGSMGGAVVGKMIADAMRIAVGRLDAVSIREKSAFPFISAMTDKTVIHVLDPTMLLGRDEWDEIAVSPDIGADYILVYNIGGNKALDGAAVKLAEHLHCEIVNLSYATEDTAGPCEFVGLIRNAKYVLTNSFHGMVFSILYRKQFLVFGVDYIQSQYSKNIRMLDLLAALKLESRFVCDNDCREIIDNVDYRETERLLLKLRMTSVEFLSESLALEKTADCDSDIATKNRCYGYGACAPACFKHGVSFAPDFLDFPYPQINRVTVGCDYMQAIFSESGIEKIFYENKLLESELERERLARELYNEVNRNSLHIKLLKFQLLGLTLDDNPAIEGCAIIYGAGKIGRMVRNSFDRKAMCYVDQHVQLEQLDGLPVYHLEDERLMRIVSDAGTVTFIITPTYDLENINLKIKQTFPNVASIIHAKNLVEKL